MIKGRCSHGAVSLGNKMFVIGGIGRLNCEVFDSSSRIFTRIERLLILNNLTYYRTSVLNIGYKILVFCSTGSSANNKFQIYDVLKDQWFSKENEFIGAKMYVRCSKLPVI